MTLFCPTLPESRELSSSPRRMLIPLQFSEERLRSAGSQLRLPRSRKRRPGRLFKDLRMRLPSSIRLLSRDQDSHLDRITLFTSFSPSKKILRRMSRPRMRRSTSSNKNSPIDKPRSPLSSQTSSSSRKMLPKSNIKSTNSRRTRSNSTEIPSFSRPKRTTLRPKSKKKINRLRTSKR